VSPVCVILEGTVTDLSMILEQIQYMMVGMFHVLICILFIKKNDAITSNYNLIRNDFIQWSEKRGVDPNETYKKNLRTVKYSMIPIIIVISCITLGPLFTAINDIGKLPLDSKPHFVLFWPKVSKSKYITEYVNM
jgi:hypothetical protein